MELRFVDRVIEFSQWLKWVHWEFFAHSDWRQVNFLDQTFRNVEKKSSSIGLFWVLSIQLIIIFWETVKTIHSQCLFLGIFWTQFLSIFLNLADCFFIHRLWTLVDIIYWDNELKTSLVVIINTVVVFILVLNLLLSFWFVLGIWGGIMMAVIFYQIFLRWTFNFFLVFLNHLLVFYEFFKGLESGVQEKGLIFRA